MNSRSMSIAHSHHSRLCPRKKARHLHHSFRSLVASVRKTLSEGYFTRTLPAELRLLIYQYVLHFDRPLKLQRRSHRRGQSRTASILCTSRLIHAEALPVLYNQNTFTVHLAELCTHPAKVGSSLTCRAPLVRKLFVCDLKTSKTCAALSTGDWPAPQQMCDKCCSLTSFLASLQRWPRLERVVIDDHPPASSSRNVQPRTRHMPYGVRAISAGVGQYRLEGSWLGHLDVWLCDIGLAEIWSRCLSWRRANDPLSFLRDCSRLHRDLRDLERRYDRMPFRVLSTKLALLFNVHDAGGIPRSMAMIWPTDLPTDFRVVNNCNRPDFLHDFNERLVSVIANPLSAANIVPRRL